MAKVGDQPETIKRKSKKEKGKALLELKSAPSSGKKFKRACYTKDQMVIDTLAKEIEFSIKVNCTPSQEFLPYCIFCNFQYYYPPRGE
jgi:hypothetical protein